MTSLETIKLKVRDLYHSHPDVHINVSINNPKLHLTGEPAVIKGVYPHIFRIETQHHGSHTLQYTDILTSRVEIEELKKKIKQKQG